MEEKIRLNFYSIDPQEFTFYVWRKPWTGEKKEGELLNLYKGYLPYDDNPNLGGGYYWISFKAKPNFEKFRTHNYFNNHLTLKFLSHLLKKKSQDVLLKDEYLVENRSFINSVEFVSRKHTEGRELISLKPYYLQTEEQFGFLIDFRFSKDSNISFSRSILKLSLSLDKNFRSNKNYYIDKFNKIASFFDLYESQIFPLEYDENKLSLKRDPVVLTTKMLEPKDYIFKNTTNISQFKGVEKDGPFEEIFRNIELIFVYRKKDYYKMEDLKNGLKGKKFPHIFPGLEQLFKLVIAKIHFMTILDYTKSELDKVIKKIYNFHKKSNENLIIPLFIADKNNEEAYFHMKYKLLEKEIPLQVVTYQLLKNESNLKWSLSNIGLQIFSKLGGKPWKVSSSDKNRLLMGIGQSHLKKNNEIKKYFAYSVCTDSSGIYKKINVMGNSKDENNYLDQLRANIIKITEEFIIKGYTSFVLHIPAKIRKKELESIHSVIKEFSHQKNVDFIVLKVNQYNKYFGFAYSNSLVPFESTYVKISQKPLSFLIWFEGLQFHRKTIYKKIPGPVHVEFYWCNRKLNEHEIKEHLQDVLNLSGANWRGFNAKHLPITIYYCQLVARFLKQFPDKVDFIDNIENPWFL